MSIKPTDIAYNGLTYEELGKIFYEAGIECPMEDWSKSDYKILYFEGLKAVFDAVAKERDKDIANLKKDQFNENTPEL